MESIDKDQIQKKITEVQTFPVPFPLTENQVTLTINTNTPFKQSEEQIINKARQLHKQGNIPEATKYYQQLMNEGCNDYRVFSNYGAILIGLGKLKEAESYTRKAIEIKPDFAGAYSNLGTILTDRGKLQDSELSLRKAIELDPKSANFKLNLGINQFALGDMNSSLETLELAYKLDPNNKKIKALLAILKERQKNKPKNLRLENIINSLSDKQSEWTPIVLHRSVEEELIQKLYSLKAEEKSRPIYGNINGSDYFLFENDFPILRYFQKDLLQQLSEYFGSEIFITESFFNIIKPKDGIGGGSKIHNHLGREDQITQIDIAKQKFSLVYYLSIGDKSGKDPGILKFHNPDNIFLPEEGMIVIFPASRLHSVHYDGKKDRVVIVVNFYVL